MGDTPLTHDETGSSLTTVSSMTSYSISITDSGPSITFFEAQQLFDSQEESVDKIVLSERDFTVWQAPSTDIDILDGLRITPP